MGFSFSLKPIFFPAAGLASSSLGVDVLFSVVFLCLSDMEANSLLQISAIFFFTKGIKNNRMIQSVLTKTE